jgi:hypothetical protein
MQGGAHVPRYIAAAEAFATEAVAARAAKSSRGAQRFQQASSPSKREKQHVAEGPTLRGATTRYRATLCRQRCMNWLA